MELPSIKSGRLYGDLAYLMPVISPREDYAEEARFWRQLLREKLGEGRHPVLELGVGCGLNLSHLTATVDAVGVDLSEEMLRICRTLNPDVETRVGDMRSVRLGRTFSAVLIHDAVGHLITAEDLARTFRTAAVHLQKGGVLIAAPDYFKETFVAPVTESSVHKSGGVEVAYFEYAYDPDPSDTTIEILMSFVINDKSAIKIEYDKHTLGLFPRAVWLRALTDAGFDAEIRPFSLKGLNRPYELLVGVLE